MAGQYATAKDQIREMLHSRTQGQPLWTWKHVSDQLTVWPIPAPRSIRRMMAEVRAESELGHYGQKTEQAA